MAHILTLTHGSNTVTVTSGSYALVRYVPEANGLDKATVTETMMVYVSGATVSAFQANLQALVGAFEAAERRARILAGDRVWLNFTPSGYDHAYRAEVLSGKVDLPEGALKADWANLGMDVSVTLTRRNFWEDTEDTWLGLSNSIPVTFTERRPAGDADKNWRAVASDSDGSNLIAVTYGGRLWTSDDGGATWTERRPAGDADKDWEGVTSDGDGSVLLTYIFNGRLYLSVNAGVAWAEVQPAGAADKLWQCVASDSDGSVLLAGVGEFVGGRIYLSVDTGTNWAEVRPAGDANKAWKCAASDADGSVLLAGVYGGRLYKSIDSGTTWTEVQPAGDANKNWQSVSVDEDGSHMIAAVSGGRIYVSSDGGTTWTETQPMGDVNEDWYVVDIDSDGNNLLAGADAGRLYTSNDFGENWTERQPAGDADGEWYGVAIDSDGSNIIAADYGGRVWTSANAFPPVVSLSNDGVTYNNWLEFAAQTGFDLPCPLEMHVSGQAAVISRLYAGIFPFQNLMTDFDHFFEVGDFTSTDGTKTADAACSDGYKMAFSLTTDTVESAYAVFQSTIAKLNQVQGRKLRPFLRWAETTDIANVQVRLRLTLGASVAVYSTNWVTPATYKWQELPVIAIPRIASEVTGTFAPQYRLYLDVRRTTAATEDVAVDFITFLPADNLGVLDQGAGMVFDPGASDYVLADLPYDEDAPALLYNGTNFCGTWVRLGANPVMLYPNQAGVLVFAWRDDDGAEGAFDEQLNVVQVTFRKRRLTL